MKTVQRVGIIGYGNVGKNIANNLIRNKLKLDLPIEVSCVYDKFKKSSDFDPSHNVALSINELASKSDIIITCLGTPDDIKTLIKDENLFSKMKSNDIWIDHTTSDYLQTIEFSNYGYNNYNINTLEVPITGGISLLKQGLMTMYVSGNFSIYKNCYNILNSSSNKIFYLGNKIGNSTITKVVSNMLASVNTVALGEALMIAKKTDIDLSLFWDAIRFSAGNSFVWETEGPLIMNGTYDPNFTLELQCKDLDLGYQICKQYNIPYELHGLTQSIYNKAKYKYGDKMPSSLPPKLLEDDLNTNLRHEKFNNWSYSINNNNKDSFVVKHQFNENQNINNTHTVKTNLDDSDNWKRI